MVRSARLMVPSPITTTLALVMLALVTHCRAAAETPVLIPSRPRLRMKHSHISVCIHMVRRKTSALIGRNLSTMGGLLTTFR